MKNNTKLIMETWRRFLREGEDPMDGQYPGQDEPDFESSRPVEDRDMMSMSDMGNDDSFDSDPDVPFDPVSQSGPDDFSANVASIRELIDEQGLSDEALLSLKYTQQEIDEARAGMPGSVENMHSDSRQLSDESYHGVSMDDPSEDGYYGHDF